MNRRKVMLAAFAALGPAFVFSKADAAAPVGNTHITDGAFESNEWTVTNSLGSPLASPTISDQTFAFDPATSTGGATLYVEQSTNGKGDQTTFGTTLNLMYDYTSSPVVLGPTANATNSAIDVFFQVPNDGDYAIHITGSGFTAFEKPNGVVSPENPNGTVLFENSSGGALAPWVPFDSTDPDFAGADLHAALGFGTSPNSLTPHLIAEFDLSIDSGSPAGGSGNGSSGLYSPAPAFWSADGKSGTVDPPISSEIFTLQPNGSTLTQEVLNSAGDPVAQPSDVPEPASIALIGVGASVLSMRRRRR